MMVQFAKNQKLILGRFSLFIKNNQRALILIFFFFIEVLICFLVWLIRKDLIVYFIQKIHKYNLTTILSFLVAAPYAYCIWYWRDKNKKEDIKNAQRTIEHEKLSLKQDDFHKLQSWVAGYNCNPTMQISATYQLREYINGHKGEYFKRPTLEIFKSLIESLKPDDSKSIKNEYHGTDTNTRNLLTAIYSVIREEAYNIDKRNLQDFDFSGANLSDADFSNADLSGSNFEGAELENTNFDNSILSNVNFKKAFLSNASFKKAILKSKVDSLFEPLEFVDKKGLKFVNNDKAERMMIGKVKYILSTDFSNANLYMTDFRDATIGKFTNFKETKFCDTVWIDGTVIPKGYLGMEKMPDQLSNEDKVKMKTMFAELPEKEKRY